MKKIFSIFLIALSLVINAQVGIGTADPHPSAYLDVDVSSLPENGKKGFLLPRVTTAERNAITNPAKGLMVYNTSLSCLQVNDGTEASPVWNCLSGAPASDPSSNGSAVVSNYGNSTCDNPSSGTINGTMTQGVAVSGVTMTLYANVTNIGTWSLTATENGVTFSGSGTFATTGCHEITLTATGTPTASGSFTWTTNSTPAGSGTATVAGATDPSSNGTAIVDSYGAPACTAGSINGSMTEGVAVSGVTMTIWANVTQVGTYNITAGPVNGVTFSGSGTFVATGCQEITLTATGTPDAAGSFDYTLNTTPTETVSATVAAAFDPTGITPGAGSLSGRTCFDIALSNDNTNSCAPLTARTATQADFTDAATHTQTYTFTPIGTVSNVRFYYINDVGNAVIAITGGNAGNNISTAQTATVNYNTNNNTLALGLTNSNPMTTRIFAVYNINATNNNNPADDRVLALTANVKDCACCVAKINATDWKEFLCHNLGADTSLDPHDMAQTNAWGLNGAYVQWGRRGPNTTGDSRVDWVNAANTSNFAAAPTGSTAGTANSGSISGWSTTDAANNSWRTTGGAKTADDPCPAGWRVPTSAEWTGVNSNNTVSRSGAWTNSATYYNSALHYGPNASTKLLTLPAAGYRSNTSGTLSNRGNSGYYWSSTENSTNARNLFFDSSNVSPAFSIFRTYGFSVRCITE
jgi:uncharacterized protein (TIGR02145 family)